MVLSFSSYIPWNLKLYLVGERGSKKVSTRTRGKETEHAQRCRWFYRWMYFQLERFSIKHYKARKRRHFTTLNEI